MTHNIIQIISIDNDCLMTNHCKHFCYVLLENGVELHILLTGAQILKLLLKQLDSDLYYSNINHFKA